ncbi:MAG: aspartate carbamoyltransferase catalytic subunit [Gammaproteobacteria bacterium]
MNENRATSLQLDNNGKLRHLITLAGLPRPILESILDRAEQLMHAETATQFHPDQPVALLFYEPSTRTRGSFSLAAWRLGYPVINLEPGQSSIAKSETLEDTVSTLEAMGVRYLVLRHAQDGVFNALLDPPDRTIHCISAGEAHQSHPTQGLLDLLTIRQHFPDLAGLSVAIVGDLAHSRVARSTFTAMRTFGITDIRLSAPPEFEPDPVDFQGATNQTLTQALEGVQLIIALRVQSERLTKSSTIEPGYYFSTYGLTSERLRNCHPDVRIMHPGPIHPGMELASDLINSPRSLIRQQVHNGVLIRMAVYEELRS